MKRQAPLWLIGVLVWQSAFVIVTGIIFYVNSRKPDPSGSSHWPFICVMASAITAFLGPGLLRKQSHWPCVLAIAGSFVLSALAHAREAWRKGM